jgi:hypothetical protein
MNEELYALDKVVDDLVPHCRIRVTTSTSTPRGESLSRVSAIPCCGTVQYLTFVVGRLGPLWHLEPLQGVSLGNPTDELATPGPNGQNNLFLINRQDLNAFGLLYRLAALAATIARYCARVRVI